MNATKMKAKIAAVMVIVLSIPYPSHAALASDLFYVGDIAIDSIAIRIEADSYATVNALYVLVNRGGEEEVDLQFAQSPVPLQVDGEELDNPVVFEPGEGHYISLTCNLDITGETTKMLSIDPTLLFNRKPNNERTRMLTVEVLLPEGVSGLVWANQEPDEQGFEGSRRLYTWSSTDTYPTTLYLKWSTLPVELGVVKEASPQEITGPDQVINLEITVQNKGDSVVDNISLIDQYLVSDFEAVEPLVEFDEQEIILRWMTNIDWLGPGESKTLAYSVRYVGFTLESYEFDLEPCMATVDGHLVSVSNEVRMIQSGSPEPSVATQAATDVSTDSATLNMDYNAGSFVEVEVCFVCKKSADPNWSYTDWVSKSGDGPYAASITGLDSDTEYEFIALLRCDDGTAYQGITNQFTTEGEGGGGVPTCPTTTADIWPLGLVSVTLVGLWTRRWRGRR